MAGASTILDNAEQRARWKRMLGLRAVRDGGEWDGLPVAGHELQVLQGLDRAAFRVACSRQDFHQIDVITDLRDCGAADDAVQRLRNGLGSDAELPRLVLQHLQLHDARRFHPVKADILEQWMGADFRRQLLGGMADVAGAHQQQQVAVVQDIGQDRGEVGRAADDDRIDAPARSDRRAR